MGHSSSVSVHDGAVEFTLDASPQYPTSLPAAVRRLTCETNSPFSFPCLCLSHNFRRTGRTMTNHPTSRSGAGRFLPRIGSPAYHLLLAGVAILILGPLGGGSRAFP